MPDPTRHMIPEAGRALMARIADAAASPREARLPFRIQGAGSKAFFGRGASSFELLSTAALSGITSYEPSELVISVLGGTPLAEVEAALAEQGQCLAFEPPRFGHSGDAMPTIGGVVASGLSGPSRASAGGVRDFMLGVQIINGQGQWLQYGGQVMKNVAGYDVSRLMAGSWGTLGVIAEVSLKVLPRARAQATLRFELGQPEALDRLNRWGGQPLPLHSSVWQAVNGKGVLTLKLSGAQAAVDAACASLGGERLADASDFWASWRDQRAAFFAAPSPHHSLYRLSVPQTTVSVDRFNAESQAIEWHGGQRWVWLDEAAAEGLAQHIETRGGSATLFVAQKSMNPQTKSQNITKNAAKAAAQALQGRLQAEFDPHGVFDAARLTT